MAWCTTAGRPAQAAGRTGAKQGPPSGLLKSSCSWGWLGQVAAGRDRSALHRQQGQALRVPAVRGGAGRKYESRSRGTRGTECVGRAASPCQMSLRMYGKLISKLSLGRQEGRQSHTRKSAQPRSTQARWQPAPSSSPPPPCCCSLQPPLPPAPCSSRSWSGSHVSASSSSPPPGPRHSPASQPHLPPALQLARSAPPPH